MAATSCARSERLRDPRIAGMTEPRLITAIGETLPSLARVEASTRPPFRVGAVQEAWHAVADEHVAAIERGIAMAAGEGAQLVCLQELTLSPYFAIVPDALETAAAMAEPLPGGPTHELAARAAQALEFDVRQVEAVHRHDLRDPGKGLLQGQGQGRLARARRAHQAQQLAPPVPQKITHAREVGRRESRREGRSGRGHEAGSRSGDRADSRSSVPGRT